MDCLNDEFKVKLWDFIRRCEPFIGTILPNF
jgi:hypothetical protein